jgi:hypothetical protein
LREHKTRGRSLSKAAAFGLSIATTSAHLKMLNIWRAEI